MTLLPRKFWKDVRAVAAQKLDNGECSLTAQLECGCGKTSLPSALSHDLFKRGVIDGVIWLVPRTNLVRSAAQAMAPSSAYWELLGLGRDEARRFEINGLTEGNIPNPSRGSWGYAMSYNAAHSNLLIHLDFMRRRKVLLIADEVQFCAKDQPLGRALERLHERAAFTVFMSGDFDREDRRRVACVEYVPRRDHATEFVTDVEEVKLDVSYGLVDALDDAAVLPLDFSYGSGRVAFRKGSERIEVDALSNAGAHTPAAVWAALNSDYAKQLLEECVRSWRLHRTDGHLPRGQVVPNPKAQLMVVTANQGQAEEVRQFMVDRLGFNETEVAIAISDRPDADQQLHRFCTGDIPAIVTVAMAYVGTDAPGTTHVCVLTHYRSKAWLHQLFARAWRRAPGVNYDDDYCVAFCPDDARLRSVVDEIREAQQAGVRSMDDETQHVDVATGARAEAEHVVVETSELTGLSNRFEFGPQASPTTTLKPGLRKAPSPQATRELLIAEGYGASDVDRMLSALAAPAPRHEPSLPERLREAGQRLERYQRKTALMLAKISGEVVSSEHFGLVNRTLKARIGKEREAFDESDFTTALAVFAPKVRSELLSKPPEVRVGKTGSER